MRYVPWEIDRLEELVDLWNRELKDILPMRIALFKQNSFLDENISYEGSRIVLDDNEKVIGFVVTKFLKAESEVTISNEVGWIQAILVDSAYRNQGIGTQLLHHAEETLKQKGLREILIGRDMYHYLPGIPAEDGETSTWFERRGYQNFAIEHDMSKTFDYSEDINWPKLPEVEFSELLESEKDDLLDFLHRCFPGRWELEAIHYFKKGGTGREFIVLKENGDIIGFCRINDEKSPIVMGNMNWSPLFDREAGGVGPLGVDAEKRKNGYGLAVVQAGIAYLRQRGISHIVIDWTGLVGFYQKLGFDVWKSYKSYKKEIG